MEKTYSASQIAQWFINRSAMDVDMFYGEYINNMKLQKMLYFAQGLSYAILNKALFKDGIQAWKYGPVVKEIYHKYKVCGAGAINDVEPVEIDEETAALLEFVYRQYGIYSATKLMEISHEQKPYKQNFVPNKENIKIPNEEIREEFSKNKDALIEEFNKNKQELNNFAETCYINSIPELKNKIINTDDEIVEVDWKDEL